MGFDYEVCGLMGCNVMQFEENLTYWRNMLVSFSVSKSRSGKKSAESYSKPAGFLLGLVLNPKMEVVFSSTMPNSL
jgi:hypothetical protein